MISYQTPEERWASTLWEHVIFIGSICVKNVVFIPSGPIYPDGASARMILRDENEDLATLVLAKDVKRFEPVYFSVIPTSEKYRMLILRKELSVGKNIALPPSLVQVESWQ